MKIPPPDCFFLLIVSLFTCTYCSNSILWEPSLTFPSLPQYEDQPLPVHTMNLASHKGRLYAGMATSFEKDSYSNADSYVYVKKHAEEEWQLDKAFGRRTLRIDALASVRFEYDGNGNKIADGPIDILLATTKMVGIMVHIRDDQNENWELVTIKRSNQTGSIRQIGCHRDPITGADMVFLTAYPPPYGIISGVYDPSQPGKIRWNPEPELIYEPTIGSPKWFGIDECNGILYASNNSGIYRRIDGPSPSWVQVYENTYRGQNPEIRGITGIPNNPSVTGWPEDEHLLYSSQMAIWRMRCNGEKAEPFRELDLVAISSKAFGVHAVFAEAAFNTLCNFKPSAQSEPLIPIGYQMLYSTTPVDPNNYDPDQIEKYSGALYVVRNPKGEYLLDSIVANDNSILHVVRDFEPSPFSTEPNALYAGGFNGSYYKGSIGTAWIYKGAYGQSPVKRTTLSRSFSNNSILSYIKNKILYVYPDVSNKKGLVRVTLTNSCSQVVRSVQKSNNRTIAINLHGLPYGLYINKITIENKNHIAPILFHK